MERLHYVQWSIRLVISIEEIIFRVQTLSDACSNMSWYQACVGNTHSLYLNMTWQVFLICNEIYSKILATTNNSPYTQPIDLHWTGIWAATIPGSGTLIASSFPVTASRNGTRSDIQSATGGIHELDGNGL
jgi:hypothetical protein